jgi:hypothetical protein
LQRPYVSETLETDERSESPETLETLETPWSFESRLSGIPDSGFQKLPSLIRRVGRRFVGRGGRWF